MPTSQAAHSQSRYSVAQSDRSTPGDWCTPAGRCALKLERRPGCLRQASVAQAHAEDHVGAVGLAVQQQVGRLDVPAACQGRGGMPCSGENASRQ